MNTMRIVPCSPETVKALRSTTLRLTAAERAFCWRIVLSGEPVIWDATDKVPFRTGVSVSDALRYITLNGDIL